MVVGLICAAGRQGSRRARRRRTRARGAARRGRRARARDRSRRGRGGLAPLDEIRPATYLGKGKVEELAG
jgi:hypothetical protein